MPPLRKLLEAAAATTTPLAAAHLHAHLLRSGLLHSSYHLAAHVLESYTPGLARDLFDEIPCPTPRLANALLRAHLRARQWRAAIRLVPRLRVCPDGFTFPLLLRACAMLPSLAHGRAVHAVAVRSCAASEDAFVVAAVVQMYARCGDMAGAVNAYGVLEKPDVVLLTSVVTGYEQNGLAMEAMEFFARNVVGQGVAVTPVTLVSVISAAAQLGDAWNGRASHAYLVRNSLGYNLALVNAVLGFYVKIGDVQTARRLFEGMVDRDVVTWSSMIKDPNPHLTNHAAEAAHKKHARQEEGGGGAPPPPSLVRVAFSPLVLFLIPRFRRGNPAEFVLRRPDCPPGARAD